MKQILYYIVFSHLADVIWCQNTYYCDSSNKQVSISTQESGRLITRYEGDSVYRNSQRCQWRLDSGSASRHIQLTVETTHLEWAPVNAICNGYDFVEITDDQDRQSRTWIVAWCGDRNPYSVTSSGQYLYVTFQANDRNQYTYRGASILFRFFDVGSGLDVCPPGWSDDATLLDGGDYCYVVKDQTATWPHAQQYCGYEQANLASAANERELTLMQELGQSKFGESPTKIWIGLNDIEVDEEYKWIDEITSSVKDRWRPTHKKSEYLNCVVMDSADGLWEEQFCNENNIKTPVENYFMCKCHKSGTTKVYRAPQQRLEKGGTGGLNIPIPWIIIGIVGAVVVIIVIIVVAIKCGVCKKNNMKTRTSSTTSASIPMTTRDPPQVPSTRALQYTDDAPQHSMRDSPSYRSTRGNTSPIANAPPEPPPAYDDIVAYK